MDGEVGYTGPMKTKAKRVTEGRGPSTVNGKVPPRRLTNAERRPREYLTPEEVERLITTAQKRIGARTPHRDATMILLAYRHGLRASELCSLRWDMLDLAPRSLPRHPPQERPAERAPSTRHRDPRAPATAARAGAGEHLRVHHRAARAHDAGDLPQAAGDDRPGGQAPLPRSPAHAPARVRLQARTRWPRHPGAAGVARALQHPEHDALHRAHEPSLQSFWQQED